MTDINVRLLFIHRAEREEEKHEEAHSFLWLTLARSARFGAGFRRRRTVVASQTMGSDDTHGKEEWLQSDGETLGFMLERIHFT